MQSIRFIAIIVAFLGLPFFSFAQTATSTAEQPSYDSLQQSFDKLIQEQLDSAPKAEDLLLRAVEENLEVKIIPPNPGPNEVVKITIQSYLTDLNKASISWKLNNKIVSSGIGERSFTFTNGKDGSTTNLIASLALNTGAIITKSFSWTPVGVTLFWEADTYTPPFYKGKPLLSPEAKIKVIANPNKTGLKNTMNADNLIYIWKNKGTVDSNASGYGKNSYSFYGPKPFNTAGVSVQISSLDNTINSEKKLNLLTTNPLILLYENSPLLGVLYNKPLGSLLDLSKKELSISSAPFFFSKEPAGSQTVEYKWLVNGKITENNGKEITLRNETGEVGSAQVSLSVVGLHQTFQTATKNLRINFTENTTDRPLF